LGVELATQEPGVVRQLDHLHELAVRAHARDPQAGGGPLRQILLVDFVTVAVAFGDAAGAVDLGRQAAFPHLAGIGPQAHGAPHLLDAQQVAQLVDDRVPGLAVELGGARSLDAADVARVFDDHALHAEADAEHRDTVFAGVADRADLALGAPGSETDRHQQAVDLENFPRPGLVLEGLGVDVDEFDRGVVGDAAVHQGLVQALVGVGQLHVLADDADAGVRAGTFDPGHQ